MVQFLNPPEWNGEPFVVGDLFVLRKGNRTARCVLQTHSLGLELRLSAGRELLQSQVCRRCACGCGLTFVRNGKQRYIERHQAAKWQKEFRRKRRGKARPAVVATVP